MPKMKSGRRVWEYRLYLRKGDRDSEANVVKESGLRSRRPGRYSPNGLVAGFVAFRGSGFIWLPERPPPKYKLHRMAVPPLRRLTTSFGGPCVNPCGIR